jgi:hypothetical protein
VNPARVIAALAVALSLLLASPPSIDANLLCVDTPETDVMGHEVLPPTHHCTPFAARSASDR